MTTNDPRPEFTEMRRRFGTPTPEPVETIDHKAQALIALDNAATHEPGTTVAAEYVAIAQVQATLYLADEARETNRRAEKDMQVRHEMAKQAFAHEAARPF